MKCKKCEKEVNKDNSYPVHKTEYVLCDNCYESLARLGQLPQFVDNSKRRTQRTFVRKSKPAGNYRWGSPYWDSIFGKFGFDGSDNNAYEDKRAKPDNPANSLEQLYLDQQEIDKRKTVLKELLKVAIKRSQLTDKQYKYINLVFYENKSLTEIADSEGIAVATVSVSIKNGIKKVKKVADSMAKNL